MKTELEIKMETCPHKLVELRAMGFPEAEYGWYCTLCGCTIKGNKIIPATSFAKPVDSLRVTFKEMPKPIEEIDYHNLFLEYNEVYASHNNDKICEKLNEVIRKLNSL